MPHLADRLKPLSCDKAERFVFLNMRPFKIRPCEGVFQSLCLIALIRSSEVKTVDLRLRYVTTLNLLPVFKILYPLLLMEPRHHKQNSDFSVHHV